MTPDQSQRSLTGYEISKMWGQLSPEHLRVALKALEPQLAREEAFRLAQLNAEMEEKKDRRAHVQHMTGLVAGLLIAIGTLAGAVMLGIHAQPWLALLLSGPSVFALVKIFVLRRTTSNDLKELRRAQASAAQAALPPAVQAPSTPPIM
ncbi:hypothetical protein Misp01_30210 [Microtetraspora sp. NBRC 13810]|uniref:hypothetical protein n=1 Tax=Microtetraspora sp. NBRC 13810 TaxID=3030990 RepID=UPI0024A2F48D|nr:hypothetical protein [Microtetraspora sp. NBRC 13810]GLW07891.1 hypothetical protein Misp01_30210 [Microtetraspora sp. NBRC 13810]